jgi:hypothetical protein
VFGFMGKGEIAKLNVAFASVLVIFVTIAFSSSTLAIEFQNITLHSIDVDEEHYIVTLQQSETLRFFINDVTTYPSKQEPVDEDQTLYRYYINRIPGERLKITQIDKSEIPYIPLEIDLIEFAIPEDYIIPCTDSDRGLSYYMKGTVLLSVGPDTGPIVFNDTCIDTNTLKEYSCAEELIAEHIVKEKKMP